MTLYWRRSGKALSSKKLLASHSCGYVLPTTVPGKYAWPPLHYWGLATILARASLLIRIKAKLSCSMQALASLFD